MGMSEFQYGQQVEVAGRSAKITAEPHPGCPTHDGAIPLYEIQFQDGQLFVCQETQIRASGISDASGNEKVFSGQTRGGGSPGASEK
jgi:hypothetical protein